MRRNVGQADRALRGLGGLGMVIAALVAPVPLAAGVVLGSLGGYMLASALAGRCLGYRLLGRSTCPMESRR